MNPGFSAHFGYLFTELPLAERFAAARRSGFVAVEHPSPYAMPAAEFRRHVQDEGLSLVQIALPAGDPARGEKGMAALPGREVEFRVTLETGITYATESGARFIQLQSGLQPPEVAFDVLWDTYLRNLTFAAKRAAQAGLGVLIEPIGPGTLEGYFMGNSALALRAVRELQEPNLGMLFDVFHAANAGEDPLAFIATNSAAIRHLHIADYPGRNQPGTGTIDFPALFRLLADIGYAGLIGCEYKPTGHTMESLAWLEPFIKQAEE